MTEPKEMSHDEAVASMRQATLVTRWIGIILFCLISGISYWVWPAGVMDAPLATMTMRELLRVIASGAIELAALYFLIAFWN